MFNNEWYFFIKWSCSYEWKLKDTHLTSWYVTQLHSVRWEGASSVIFGLLGHTPSGPASALETGYRNLKWFTMANQSTCFCQSVRKPATPWLGERKYDGVGRGSTQPRRLHEKRLLSADTVVLEEISVGSVTIPAKQDKRVGGGASPTTSHHIKTHITQFLDNKDTRLKIYTTKSVWLHQARCLTVYSKLSASDATARFWGKVRKWGTHDTNVS